MLKSPENRFDPTMPSADELAYAQLKNDAAAEKRLDDLNDFYEEETAIELGRDITATGKVIRRHGSMAIHKKPDDDKDKGLSSIIGGLFGAAAVASIMSNIIQFSQSFLNKSFVKNSGAVEMNVVTANRNLAYGTAAVSKETQEILDDELKILNEYLSKIEQEESKGATADKNKIGRLSMEMHDLAKHFDMHLCEFSVQEQKTLTSHNHSVFTRKSQFIHNYHRVLELEHLLNAGQKFERDAIVAVYRPSLELNGGRGIRVNVADQYDQNPNETIGAPAPHNT